MSEIMDFFPKLLFVVANLCNFKIYFFTYLLPYLQKNTTHHCLNCIKAAHAITYMNELLIFAHYLWMSLIYSYENLSPAQH